jgi:hypothetical protein
MLWHWERLTLSGLLLPRFDTQDQGCPTALRGQSQIHLWGHEVWPHLCGIGGTSVA